jgi:hypothetical protein
MMASAAPEGLSSRRNSGGLIGSPNFLTEGIILKNLVINYSIFAGSETRGGYRAMSATLDGISILTDIANPQVVGFIERAIEEAIKMAIASGEQAISITISLPLQITLSDNLKAHISAKYEADPIVDSISFSN